MLSISSGSKFVSAILIALAVSSPVAIAQAGVSGETSKVDGSARKLLVGSWRLVSRVSTLASGEVLPDPGLAATPLGILIYDQSGHVAAQLSRQNRTVSEMGEECQAAAETKGTQDTSQTVLGYDAYFGTYTLNERDGIVTHHLQAAIFPGDVGKSIDRSFKLSGDQLTISFHTTTKEGSKVTRTLIWERLK